MIGIINIKNKKYTNAVIKIKNNDKSETDITINDYKNIGKCFDGDLVELDKNTTHIINIIESNIKSKKIAGILKIKSRYKYGYNKRGVEIFKFSPFDKSLPIFNVASKVKQKLIKNKDKIVDQFCTIKFLKWDDKTPQGEIISIIGPINDINNKYQILLHKYDLYKSKPKFKLDKNFDNDLFIKLCEDKYVDLTNSNFAFYSIDPHGCKDIDDVISHDKENKRIGIHIADVGTYIRYFELDNIISERHTSIYLPNKQINMIPDILATDICSLHPNKKKLVFTIWLYYDKDQIIETRIEKNIIMSLKAYTYDEADIVFKNMDIFKLSKKFGKRYLKYNNLKWTTHEMIEVFMILANHYVAKFLIFNQHKLKGNIPIMRIHREKVNKIEIKNIDYQMQKMVNILNSNKAEYIRGDNNDKYYHYGLDVYYYTHFTSPIRREVDIYVHNLLNIIINKEDFVNYQPQCDEINNTNNKIKKMERDISKIKIIEHLENNFENNYENNYENNFESFIFNINYQNDKSIRLTLYIPYFKVLYDTEIINKQLLNTLDYKMIDNKLVVKNLETNKKCEFIKYSKIIIKIFKLDDKEIVNIGINIEEIEKLLKI